MDILDILKRHGYALRQHKEEIGWGYFEPNVVDLECVNADTLHHYGVEGLREQLAKTLYSPPWGLWTFPCLDIEAPLPRLTGLDLTAATIVAPRDVPHLAKLAAAVLEQIRTRYAIDLPLVADTEAELELLDAQNLILIGGSHENRLAMKLALRYRTFFMDAGVPGDDGWVVTMHRGFHVNGRVCLQLTGAPAHQAAILKTLAEALTDAPPRIEALHVVHQGTTMQRCFPDWDAFRTSLPGLIRQFAGQHVEAPVELEALADLLAKGLDSGGKEKGIYNSAPIDIAITCARFYQQTADRRGLELFRALLFRLADYYLKTPGGAIYPADLDFRSGMLVLHYARLEHDPIFSEEDRLLFANLLLAITRSVHEFAFKLWPPEKAKLSRHNHQTFPALSLVYAADYFQRYKLPYLHWWHEYAESIFTDEVWTRFKHGENSGLYEPLVFEHTAAYALFTGAGLSRFAPGNLREVVSRQIASTDTFFRMVDYGDCAINLKPVDPILARLLATEEDGLVRWYAGEGFARQTTHLVNSLFEYPGLRLGKVSGEPTAGQWERPTLDPAFLAQVSPDFPPELAYDKLVFRTGWNEDDHYLLVEGIGEGVSHSHRDTNGLVRLNHLGRHWVVSNGYGKRLDISHASKAFSARVLGPEDHNVLVLYRNGESIKEMPMASLLQLGQQGEIHYATTALLGYGGTNWTRTLILCAGKYLLIVDRLEILEPGLESAHLEWNCLGDVTPLANGFRLDQNGVAMEITSSSEWARRHEPMDRSASWKSSLESDLYPHASFPLAKLVFDLPEIAAGKTLSQATLFAAGKGKIPYHLTAEGDALIIQGPHAGNCQVADGNLRITTSPTSCQIQH